MSELTIAKPDNTKTPLRILAVCLMMAVVFASPTAIRMLRSSDTGPAPGTGVPAGMLSIQDRIDLWAGKADANPNDAVSRAFLADSWLSSGRRSGNAAAFEAARIAADEALAITPGYTPAELVLAGVEAANHEFAAVVENTTAILDAESDNAQALSLRADAQLELGQLSAAWADLETLGEIEPGPATTVRQARYHALTGANARAIALAETAENEALALDRGAEFVADYQVQRAVIAFETGDVDAAAEAAERALENAPDTPVVIATAARMAAADGDTAGAIELYAKVAELLPNTTWLAAYADLLDLDDEPELAVQTRTVVETLGVLGQADGLAGERAYSRYLADRANTVGVNDVDTALAVKLAELEVAARPDAHSHDTLAWAALANRDLALAEEAIATALATGIDHPVIRYHAAMIALANDNPILARADLERALELNPVFDPVHAAQAQFTLDELARDS